MPMSSKTRTDNPWWSLATAVVLTIAAALALFSTVPQMASNDLTAQMTPQVSEAPMRSQASSLVVPFRGALPREQIGVAGNNHDHAHRFGYGEAPRFVR